MKVLGLTENNYSIFIIKESFNKIDFSKEKDLEKIISKIILYLKYEYDLLLKGIYEVEIFINNKVGAFIYIEKIDTYIPYKDIDLKIKVILESTFYFKTKDYDVLKDKNNVYLYQDEYYINVNELDNIIKYIEFGEVIHNEFFDIKECTKIQWFILLIYNSYDIILTKNRGG